jgi:signal peptidase I
MPDPQMRRSDAASAVSRPVAAAKSQVREYAEALGVALLLALVIRTFVVQAFKIPSGSMLPTLQIGDHLLVNKFVYGPRLEVPLTDVSLGRLPGLRKPRPGDVIVFLAPARASSDRQRRDFIKRVIAVEGQTIEVRAKQVYIDGKPWDDPHATFLTGKPDPATERPSNPLLRQCGNLESGSGHSCAIYTVPPGYVFVMGDNREQSYDSRFWGPVPIDDIKGQALIIYWSWDGAPDRWVRWERIGRLVN